MSSGTAKRERRGQRVQVNDSVKDYAGSALKTVRKVGKQVDALRFETQGKAAAERNLSQQMLDVTVKLRKARRTIIDLKWALLIAVTIIVGGVLLILGAVL